MSTTTAHDSHNSHNSHDSQSSPSAPPNFAPPDTTAASAAYALIDVHPIVPPSHLATMPPLPEDALTRQSIYNRLSLIAARCELMLLDNVDRMAVRGLIDDKDMKKFDQVTTFLIRLTSVRKSLDAYLQNESNAPSPSTIQSDLTTALSDYLDSQTVPSAPPADQPAPPSPNNQQSAISNPQSEIRNPQFHHSSFITHHSSAPRPFIHAVPCVPTLPIESIPAVLSDIHSALTHPGSTLNQPALPPIPPDREKERRDFTKWYEDWKARRPDPKHPPTSFNPQPETHAAGYETCPDCAHCQTPSCITRVTTPEFVTCIPNCAECAYNFECPWVPIRFKTDI